MQIQTKGNAENNFVWENSYPKANVNLNIFNKLFFCSVEYVIGKTSTCNLHQCRISILHFATGAAH